MYLEFLGPFRVLSAAATWSSMQIVQDYAGLGSAAVDGACCMFLRTEHSAFQPGNSLPERFFGSLFTQLLQLQILSTMISPHDSEGRTA